MGIRPRSDVYVAGYVGGGCGPNIPMGTARWQAPFT